MTDVLEQGQQAVPVALRVPQRGRSTMWVALAGAVAYSSWPLAFLANPSLAGTALASSFEGRSQPFSWLFILLDCIAGLCTAIVCIRELRPRSGGQRPGKALVSALLGYGVFGMATAVDAVVPLSCGSASARACASQLWPLTPDDYLTGVAMLALFVAATTVVVQMTRRPLGILPAVPVTVTLIGWSSLGLVVVLGGSATVAAVSQYSFLTLTSILAFVVPLGAISSRDAGRRASRSRPDISGCARAASLRSDRVSPEVRLELPPLPSRQHSRRQAQPPEWRPATRGELTSRRLWRLRLLANGR